MASWLDLTDPSLEKGFNAPVYRPEPGRAQVVAMIDKAITQYQANPDSKAPNRVWKKGTNGGVSFAPKIKGKELILGGKETHYIPADKFVDALKQLKAAVEGKEYDADIKAALDSVKAPTTRKVGGDKAWTARKDWSDLSFAQKQTITANYRNKMNPDRSLISEVGHQPDAPIVSSPKTKSKAK